MQLNLGSAPSSVQHAHILIAIYQRGGNKPQSLYGNEFSIPLSSVANLDVSMTRWLYCLILAIDANFRLKLKEKGIINDPPLGDGWAHWVKSEPYLEYVKKYGHQVEVRP
jgi:hypothetical protein